jgi:uncharacterized protein YrrD
MTRFSEAVGRQVVSTTTADTVGRVDDFVIDPASRSIIALRLKKSDNGDTLRWSDVTAFGPDAVTVSGAELVTDPDETIEALSGKSHRVLGKLVLSDRGDELGKIADVEFDSETGTITALVLSDGNIEGIRLVGVGSYAVVVHAENAIPT